ncbi:nadph:quinone reductase [Leptolyngbya sp. Heron Island J]|uniref:NAD(P)-dependent alcohol dehydrogenase n=1 Tax=Leptolyngbya sp. Heron Island J TaxID=1385935 RepID=UPI0003B9A86E|nr:NAD(P)-dependent alcohol dehydrogenase [Leptolyngbya sp. Heron Island J]ESA35842.1 nadph:quinone reductase [Leptolyngbya sp. Heron Island J]
MKKIVYTQYGSPDAIELIEIEKPVPSDNQVLVKVYAASVNALDWHRLRGAMGIRLMNGELFKPKETSLGLDVAGRVEAVGNNVTKFQPGDKVFGIAQGSFAEYACADEHELVLKPANVSFEAAAATPVAALTALQALKDRIQPGQKVLINGASGGVGTFAVQIAKSFGTIVTAVCSPRNMDTARSIGADHLIDYTREDLTANGQQYDLIFAANGYNSIFDYRRVLGSTGIYVAAGGELAQILQALLVGPMLSKFGRKQLSFMGITQIEEKDLSVISELLASGKVVPVIDRWYPLGATSEALQSFGEEHTKGKIIITVRPDHDNS